jgi:hypothetical protein
MNTKMRKIKKTAITIIFMLFSFICFTQTYSGDLTLNTQAELDAFNYTNVTGSLIIEPNTRRSDLISNLDGLNSLNSIGGTLTIRRNTDLTNLEGLSSLTSVGGSLNISENTILTSLNGLHNINSIGESLLIEGYQITSLNGLGNINSIKGNLRIWNCGITSLNGLSSLTSIEGKISIHSNGGLTSLNGLSSITSIGGDFNIDYNSGLTSLNGLSTSLTSLGGTINVANNNNLISLSGLNNINKVNGITIQHNNSLTSLNGLNNISSSNQIGITSNNNLISLDDLSNVTSVNYLYIEDNPKLASLSGLNNLISIKNNLSINLNDNLIDLQYLSNLTSVGENIIIIGNNNLTTLEGLENINTVSGKIYIGAYYQQGWYHRPNPKLSDFCSIKQLITNGQISSNEYIVLNNSYNPTYEEIKTKCSNISIITLIKEDFGDVDEGSQTLKNITIKNTGTATLDISTITKTDTEETFELIDTQNNISLEPEETFNFSIKLNANSLGEKEMILHFDSNASNNTEEFKITGNVINIVYPLPEEVNLVNLNEDLSNKPLVIYPGGTMHRYYKITDTSNEPVQGAVINYSINNKQQISTESDENGIIDLNIALAGENLDDISDDVVTETRKEYPIVFTGISSADDESKTATTLQNDFNTLTFLLKDFDQVLKSQGISLGAGISTSASYEEGIVKTEIGASSEAKAIFDVVFIRDDVTDDVESIDITIKTKAKIGLDADFKTLVAELKNEDVSNASINSEFGKGVNKDMQFGIKISLKVHRLTNEELKLYFLNVLFKIHNIINDSNVVTYRIERYLSEYLKEIGKDKLIENTVLGSFYGFNNSNSSTSSLNLEIDLNDNKNKLLKDVTPVKKEVNISASNNLEDSEGVLFNYDYFFDDLNIYKAVAKTTLYKQESDSNVLDFGITNKAFNINIPIFGDINYNNTKSVSLTHNINVNNGYQSTGKISLNTESAASEFSILGQNYTKTVGMEYTFGYNALNTLGNKNSTMSFFSENPVYIIDNVISDVKNIKNEILEGNTNTANWTSNDFSYSQEVSYQKSLDYPWSFSIFDKSTNTKKIFNWSLDASAKINFSVDLNWGANYPISESIYIPSLNQTFSTYENIGAIHIGSYTDSPAKSEVKEFVDEAFSIVKNKFTDISDSFKEFYYNATETLDNGVKNFISILLNRQVTSSKYGSKSYTQKRVSKNEENKTSLFHFSFKDDGSVFDAETEVGLRQTFSNGEIKGVLKDNNNNVETKFLILSDLMVFNAIKDDVILENSISDFNINIEVGNNDYEYFGIDKNTAVELFYTPETNTEWSSLGEVGETTNFTNNKLGIYALGIRLNTDTDKPSIIKSNSDLINKKISYQITDIDSGINWSTLSVEVDGDFYEFERNDDLIEISFLADDNSIHIIDLWVQDNYSNSQSYNETINLNSLNVLQTEFSIIKFYPNPIKDKLTISGNDIINEIEVYNALGVLVLSEKINLIKSELDLSRLKRGVYILKIKTENSFKSYSILKE